MVEGIAQRIERLGHLWGVEPSPADVMSTAAELAHGVTRSAHDGVDSLQAVLVTKGPHAGSQRSVTEIIARTLVFGARVAAVERLDAAQAAETAESLYPDMARRYRALELGAGDWAELQRLFDRPGFTEIFGAGYSRDLVFSANEARETSGLTVADLADVWAVGRRALSASEAVEWFGRSAASVLTPDGAYDWYRGALPVGIQRVSPATFAFALRHPRIRGGRPTIIVNGQFALMQHCFGRPDVGCTAITVELGAGHSFTEFRERLVGAADTPGDCLPGSIRRDALEGDFAIDSTEPVTPWANVVHGSDGPLAGAIETARLSSYEGATLLSRLRSDGYTETEVSALVLTDPFVEIEGTGRRLTQMTKGMNLDECLAVLATRVPSAVHLGDLADLRRPLQERLILSATAPGEVRLEESSPAPISRDVSAGRVLRYRDVDEATRALGLRALARGGVGLFVPLAGTGGRFGGYAVPEGSPARMKALAPIFSRRDGMASALDIRVGRTEALMAQTGGRASYLLWCNHHSEPVVREWADRHAGLSTHLLVAPESLRFVRPDPERTGLECAAVVRDSLGYPITKADGTYFMLQAAHRCGILDAWSRAGCEYLVAANSDDVGFAVDPRIIGILDADPTLDAVIVVVRTDEQNPRPKGGYLRDRLGPRGWSLYVEENSHAKGAAEFLNTNQIYFRASSLMRGLPARPDDLPVYLEAKPVEASGGPTEALHTYRPYCEALRQLDRVVGIEINPLPTADQGFGYQPLKRAEDVGLARAVVLTMDGE